MQKIDTLIRADIFGVLIGKLEAFGDHFEHLAATAEQRYLAAEFNAFVGAIIQAFGPRGVEADRARAPATEQEIVPAEHGHESLAGLFAEIRADDAAGKRDDAHRYGKDTFKKLLEGKAGGPAARAAKEGLER